MAAIVKHTAALPLLSPHYFKLLVRRHIFVTFFNALMELILQRRQATIMRHLVTSQRFTVLFFTVCFFIFILCQSTSTDVNTLHCTPETFIFARRRFMIWTRC